MSLTYVSFVILGFLAVVLLLEGLVLLWVDTRSPEVRRVQRRLRVLEAGAGAEKESPLLKERLLSTTPDVQRLLLQIPKIEQLDRLLLQAGSTQTVSQLMLVCLITGFVGILGGLVLRWPWPLAAVVAVALAMLPVLRLTWMRSRRLDQILAQLPDALDMVSRAMRTGHAFSAALAMVGKEAQEPIAGEFRTTFDEINFGISTQTALVNLAKRVPIPDLRYFVLAAIIQLETGGNLAQLLSMLANLIRERFKLLGKIRVLSAEGKLSAYILLALPFVVVAMLQVINPAHMEILWKDPLGTRIVLGTLLMMLFGSVVMWRIIHIRV